MSKRVQLLAKPVVEAVQASHLSPYKVNKPNPFRGVRTGGPCVKEKGRVQYRGLARFFLTATTCFLTNPAPIEACCTRRSFVAGVWLVSRPDNHLLGALPPTLYRTPSANVLDDG